MHNKIDEILKAQSDLIVPIIKNGTVSSIRKHAEKECDTISKIRLELSNALFSEKKYNEVIVKHIDVIVDCFSYIYSKLGDDSRSLPTPSLRNFAMDEMREIMTVWENLPSK